MKKLFLLLTLSFLALATTNASSVFDTTISSRAAPIVDSTEITYTKVYNDIKAGLNGLGESLKIGASHVYEIVVKQQLIYSIAFSVILLIGIISLIISTIFYKTAIFGIGSAIYYDSNDPDSPYYKGKRWNKSATLFYTFLIFGISFFTIGICTFNIILTGFFNPEYGAMKDIINFIK